MRAVNLIPGDQRRGGLGAPGRSGVGVYVLLGALAAVVVAAAAWVLAGNQVTSHQSELAKVKQEAAATEQQAAALRPYRDFAQLSQTRVATVSQLAASRFDWERVMRELARALPEDVWLTSLVGTVAPGISFDGGGASASQTGGLRSAMPTPAVELVGCTESQSAVSRVMARLRVLNDVTRVSLAASEKTESAGTTAASPSGGAGTSGDCRNGNRRFPQFQIVVFFEGKELPEGAAPQGGGAGTPAPQQGAQGGQSAQGQSAQGGSTPDPQGNPSQPNVPVSGGGK